MRIWVDDNREPIDDWVWAKTYDEALDLLDGDPVDWISLDHDLGLLWAEGDDDMRVLPAIELEDERSGYTLILWMVSNKYWPEQLSVHSMNVVGAANICGVIERYSPYVYKQRIYLADRYNGELSAVLYTKT